MGWNISDKMASALPVITVIQELTITTVFFLPVLCDGGYVMLNEFGQA